DVIAKGPAVSFRHRDVTYSGTLPEVTSQLNNVRNDSRFADIPYGKKDELKILFETVRAQDKPEPYKESAIIFLDELYKYHDFLSVYNESLLYVVNKIKEDMQSVDYNLETRYVSLKTQLDTHTLTGKDLNNLSEVDKQLLPGYREIESKIELGLERLAAHRWMESKFYNYDSDKVLNNPDALLKEFNEKHKGSAFQKYDDNQDVNDIKLYLEVEIIDFYYKNSLDEISPDTIELRYIKIKE